jgi:hypothetical protein
MQKEKKIFPRAVRKVNNRIKNFFAYFPSLGNTVTCYVVKHYLLRVVQCFGFSCTGKVLNPDPSKSVFD